MHIVRVYNEEENKILVRKATETRELLLPVQRQVAYAVSERGEHWTDGKKIEDPARKQISGSQITHLESILTARSCHWQGDFNWLPW